MKKADSIHSEIAEVVEQKIAYLPHIHNLFEAPAIAAKGRPFEFLENLAGQLKNISWYDVYLLWQEGQHANRT